MEPPAVVATCDRLPVDPEPVRDADLLELRLDLSDLDDVAILEYEGDQPLILTDRLLEHGGEAEPGPERIERLDRLLDADGVWGIDIERTVEPRGDEQAGASEAVSELIEHARTAGVTIICSSHPDTVPPVDAMVDELSSAAEVGDIAKLAVPATTPAHLGALIEVTANATASDRRTATMATGPYGLVSRLAAIGLGASLVYGAPSGGTPIVEGQPSVTTLRSVVDAVR